MTKVATFALLLALPHSAIAQDSQCITRQEMSEVVVFAAPTVVESVANRCLNSLPQDAFLRTGGLDLAQRLKGEAQGSGPAVLSFLTKLGGGKMPAGLSAETMQSLARDMLGAGLTKSFKVEDCRKVDALIASLAPLPSRNIGGAVAAILGLTSKPGSKSGILICPEPQP
jgi:hypothetical protein